MDAISFALGVRGSEIRAQRLEELIFVPTDGLKKRPNEASVELTLRARNGTELVVKRTCAPDSCCLAV